MKKVFILSLLLCILSPLTFAKGFTHSGYIEELVVSTGEHWSDSDWMRIKTTDMTNGEHCSNTNWLHLDVDNDPEKTMFTAILAAKASGSQIYFQVDGCRDFGYGYYQEPAGGFVSVTSRAFADITHVYVD